ncbi:MAG: helix-turn-helix domain-containing protein [Jatrophihabitantaceae bacterium]
MTSLPAVRRVRTDVNAFERQLIDAALAGASWAELLAQLAEVVGGHCRLVDPSGLLLACTDEGAGLSRTAAGRALALATTQPQAPVTALDGWRARVVPAASGGRVTALLLITAPAGQWQLDFARAAVTAVLIEAVRRTTVGASRFEDGATLIAALRHGAVIDGEAFVAAARFGLDLDVPHCAAVLRHTGTHHRTWATALAWLDRPVEQRDEVAYTLVADAQDLSAVRTRLELAIGPGGMLAACGAPTAEANGYRESFHEATRLLHALERRGGTELPFAQAGLLQVLLAVPSERLAYFVDRHLGPLLERPELLTTLRSWLAASGSRLVVSEQLHLHRNSIGYRVGQLKTLLGVDPLDPDHGAVLHAALAAYDLLDQREFPLPERVLTTSAASQ